MLSKNAAKPKEIEVLVGRTSYFTRLFARTVYVFFEGGAFWGPLGLPWVVSAASWDPPGALRGPSGRLLARGGAKKHKKCCTVALFANKCSQNLGLAENMSSKLQPNRRISGPSTVKLRKIRVRSAVFTLFPGYETSRPPELSGGVGYETFRGVR